MDISGKMKKKVALFGLSANPPTGDTGHRGIVKALHDKQIFDEILILPVYKHMYPEKDRILEPFEDRMNMCYLNFHGMSGQGSRCLVTVSDFEKVIYQHLEKEIRQKDPSSFNENGTLQKPLQVGTMEIMEGLQQQLYPPSLYSIHLILGSDAYRDIMNGKWTRTEA
jgi:nicotinic acid mononucleotide adenylyltransferase